MGRQPPARNLGQWLGEVGSTPLHRRGYPGTGRVLLTRGRGLQAGRGLLELVPANCLDGLQRLRQIAQTTRQPAHTMHVGTTDTFSGGYTNQRATTDKAGNQRGRTPHGGYPPPGALPGRDTARPFLYEFGGRPHALDRCRWIALRNPTKEL